ncbi:choline transport protein, partial [Tremellales sp. Uapishka_1]
MDAKMSGDPSYEMSVTKREASLTTAVVEEGTQPNGHLKKNMSMLAIIGFGLEVSNGWSGISGTLLVGLEQGGAVTILYGLMFTGIMNLFIAMTLAELSSAMPSAGGQYVWSSILAPAKYRKQVSFTTGCISIFAWIVISGTVYTIIGQYVMGLAQLFHPEIVIQRWHVFVIYLVTLGFSVLWNILLAVRAPWVGTAFIYFSTAVFVSIIAACVARAPTYQSDSFVWATYTDDIGWNSAFIVVVTGLINPAYAFLGLDATVHIAEDSIRPARDIPLGLLFTVCTAWSFACDGALPFKSHLQHISPRLNVPVLAIVVSAVPVGIVGVLYLASTTAYNSIVGSAIILSYLSFVVPIVCLMLGKRNLSRERWFKLGRFGWLVNSVVVIWCGFAGVMWLFPLTSAPTGGTMNYAVVVLGIMAVLALADWLFYARHRFAGPTSDEWFAATQVLDIAEPLPSL